jgi:hypothetical protein
LAYGLFSIQGKTSVTPATSEDEHDGNENLPDALPRRELVHALGDVADLAVRQAQHACLRLFRAHSLGGPRFAHLGALDGGNPRLSQLVGSPFLQHRFGSHERRARSLSR